MLESTDSYLTQTLLFGCTSFDSETNTLVLNSAIDYILSTERFEEALFFFKTKIVFHMQLFNLFRTSRGLFHLSVFSFKFAIYIFFCIPRQLRFLVSGD